MSERKEGVGLTKITMDRQHRMPIQKHKHDHDMYSKEYQSESVFSFSSQLQ